MKNIVRLFALVLLAPILSGLAVIPACAGTYSLSVSKNSNRSAAMALKGAAVNGNVYIFTSLASNLQAFNLSGIARVDYWLDDAAMAGTPFHVEDAVPYDFQGGSSAKAVAWNAAQAANGAHTITQKIFLSSGASEADTAAFSISGGIAPGISVTLTLHYDDGSAFAGSAQILSEVMNADGTFTDTAVLSATFSTSGVAAGIVNLDPAQNYVAVLSDAAGKTVWPPAGKAFLLTAGFQLPKLSAAAVTATLRKADNTLVSYSASTK